MTMYTALEKAVMNNDVLTVPDFVKIPFIIGDGTGLDIWRAAMCGFDESIRRAYGGRRKIEWIEVLAGGRKIPAELCFLLHFALIVIDSCTRRKFYVH